MDGKLIFFDIDGTLLDHDKKLPDSTIEAIEQLKQKGHYVAIATGRGPFMFKDICQQLSIDSFVSFNGQYVEWQGKTLFKNPIQAQALSELTEFALSREHPLVYMDVNTMRSSSDYHVHIAESLGSLNMDHPETDPQYFRGKDIYQTLVFCTEEEEAPYIEKFPELKFVRWHPFSTDVIPTGGSKANGIDKVIQKLGVDKEDVYAFGDYLNDIEMLEFVGTGIAMGNAPDLVKRAADYVTKDVDQDGILHGLLKVGLL